LRDPAVVAEPVVDLALDEPPAVVRRDLVACRFPPIDGEGNPPWLLRAAGWAARRPSRRRSPSPGGADPGEAPALVVDGGRADVSPALRRDVLAASLRLRP